MAKLVNDLLALGGVVLGVIARKLLTGAADGKALIIKKIAYLADHEDIMALIVAAVAAPLDGAELGEFLLPITQDMRLDAAEFTDLADGEVALARDRRQFAARLAFARVTVRFQHKLPPAT